MLRTKAVAVAVFGYGCDFDCGGANSFCREALLGWDRVLVVAISEFVMV